MSELEPSEPKHSILTALVVCGMLLWGGTYLINWIEKEDKHEEILKPPPAGVVQAPVATSQTYQPAPPIVSSLPLNVSNSVMITPVIDPRFMVHVEGSGSMIFYDVKTRDDEPFVSP